MITAGLITFGALFFALGLIVGITLKKGECPYSDSLKQCAVSMELKEIKNFLNYDGTEQE
jgi:hypothetical protein